MTDFVCSLSRAENIDVVEGSGEGTLKYGINGSWHGQRERPIADAF